MKVGIVTIYDNNNYGNKLQCFALQQKLTEFGADVTVIHDEDKRLSIKVKKNIKKLLKRRSTIKGVKLRKRKFEDFNKKIKYSKYTVDFSHPRIKEEFEYFIVGSDQVWNPCFNRLSNLDILKFTKPNKRISYAASFGINDIPAEYQNRISNEIAKFKAISVREDKGKEIIEKCTARKDIQVLIDPTMMLTSNDWDKVIMKPEQAINKKYILKYFLGNISKEKNDEINRIAKENDCEIIDISDKNSPFYQTGPSEFLYLEKNAFLICTDSFHSCVFAILYNVPFIVFNREHNGTSMNSRITTLLLKFQLENRYYKGKINNQILQADYTIAYKILEKERKKSLDFLKKALDIKE